MPVSGLSTGIDVRINFSDINGIQRFLYLESFTSSENATVNEKVQINGVTQFPKFHLGWKGTFMLQRGSAAMDNYIANQEAFYYSGINQLPMSITQTITENNGSISQWQYTNVTIVMDNAGDWTGTEIVTQSISFNASRRLPLA